MATRPSAKMPPLKHALVLQAELETLKVQVEALRHCLAELAAGSETLLRESNPMTASARHVAKLLHRAEGILLTYASAQVRAHYDKLAADKVVLDYLEACAVCLRRHNGDWFLDVSAGPAVRHQGPLRDILKSAFSETQWPPNG